MSNYQVVPPDVGPRAKGPRKFRIVFSPGGEEFVVNATGPTQASALADDLRRSNRIQSNGADISAVKDEEE